MIIFLTLILCYNMILIVYSYGKATKNFCNFAIHSKMITLIKFITKLLVNRTFEAKVEILPSSCFLPKLVITSTVARFLLLREGHFSSGHMTQTLSHQGPYLRFAWYN